MTNLLTGETLFVVRVEGEELWLRNEAGEIEHALRDQLPAERWCFDDAPSARTSHPRIAATFDFPAGLFQFRPSKARSAP